MVYYLQVNRRTLSCSSFEIYKITLEDKENTIALMLNG